MPDLTGYNDVTAEITCYATITIPFFFLLLAGSSGTIKSETVIEYSPPRLTRAVEDPPRAETLENLHRTECRVKWLRTRIEVPVELGILKGISP